MTAAQTTMGTSANELRSRFDALLASHRKIAFKVSSTYVRERADREDLAQEIITQCWRSFASYDGSRPFSTWMYRIALNVAISFTRNAQYHDRHSVALDHDSHDIPHDADPEGDERIRALYRFIDLLNPLDRALLLLYLEERSYREMADILGISETNVATKIGRLKLRIRADMAQDD